MCVSRAKWPASRAARATAVNSRLVSLQAEVTTAEQKLKRLYQSIANGIVELGEQITILKAQREKAKAADVATKIIQV